MKKKIPRRYLDGGYDQKVERAEKYFEKGFIIEAFAILFASIEQRLKQSWHNYVRNLHNKKYYDDFELKFTWEFHQITRNFRELDQLSEKEYQKFCNFKSGRDKAVHELPFPLESDKTNMKTLEQTFKNGLEANKIAKKLQNKFPFISEEEFGKTENHDKILIWLSKEQARVRLALKKKSEL